MSDSPQLLLQHHLKALKLPTFLREYDKVARQCAAEGVDQQARAPGEDEAGGSLVRRMQSGRYPRLRRLAPEILVGTLTGADMRGAFL